MFINEQLSNYPKLRTLTRFLIGHAGFIAGGCFKHILSGDKPTDLDMFFRNAKDFDRATEFFSKSDDFLHGYTNKNVISFVEKSTGIRVECIRKIFGSPEQILRQFDFTIVKIAYEIEATAPEDEDDLWNYDHVITYHDKFFEHLYMHKLVIDDAIPYPASTFNRICKYARYGFSPCRDTKLLILKAVNALSDIKDDDLSKAMYDGHD